MTDLPLAPTFSECVEVLRRDLLRARTVVGCRWASPCATPSLSGSERYELGLLLDALHDIPAYLSALASGEPDLVLANIVERALGDGASSHSCLDEHAPATAPTLAWPDWRLYLADDDLDDDYGPFGPARDT
jgi:hypothetical protein